MNKYQTTPNIEVNQTKQAGHPYPQGRPVLSALMGTAEELLDAVNSLDKRVENLQDRLSALLEPQEPMPMCPVKEQESRGRAEIITKLVGITQLVGSVERKIAALENKLCV